MNKSEYAQRMGLCEEAIDGWEEDSTSIVEIEDSHLYKVTFVVAIPNYTSDMGAKQQASALDLMMDLLMHEPDITILNISETRLELREVK